MSLQAQSIPPIPDLTAKVARRAFRKGNTYMQNATGIFPSLDPFEGIHDRPMSLNGYSWVEGNAGLFSQKYEFTFKANSIKTELMVNWAESVGNISIVVNMVID